jgi:hypothetical protein
VFALKKEGPGELTRLENAGSSGVWRALFAALLCICRMLAVMLAVMLVLPLALSKAILASVAAGWLPPKAAVMAYLLPLPFFLSLAVLCPLALLLRSRARWAQMLYRVFAGDTEQCVDRVLSCFFSSASLPREPGGEFAAEGNIGYQKKKCLYANSPGVEKIDSPPDKAEN